MKKFITEEIQLNLWECFKYSTINLFRWRDGDLYQMSFGRMDSGLFSNVREMIPSQALEFYGLYWQSDTLNIKIKNYLYNKTKFY